jgi:hypothetical protein
MQRVTVPTATPSGWTDTGDCVDGSDWISGLNPGTIAGINIGDYVTVSANFPSAIERYLVINKTSVAIRLTIGATATGPATVVQVDKMYSDGVAGLTPRTTLNARHLNQIQEELVNVLRITGASLSDTDNMQVYNAINNTFLRKAGGQMAGNLDLNNFSLQNAAAVYIKTLMQLAGIEAGAGVPLESRAMGIKHSSLAASTNLTIGNLHVINNHVDKWITLEIHGKYTINAFSKTFSGVHTVQVPHDPVTYPNFTFLHFLCHPQSGGPSPLNTPSSIDGIGNDLYTVLPEDFDTADLDKVLVFFDANGTLSFRNLCTGYVMSNIHIMARASYGQGWMAL